MLKGELFCGDMVRAYQDGRKKHTARPAKIEFLPGFNPEWSGYRSVYEYGEFFLEGSNHRDATKRVKPKYQPGDFMYCRETFSKEKYRIVYKANYSKNEKFYIAGKEIKPVWTPSIHMPRSAARLFFRVSRVEVMRLEDVTEEFAREDGFQADDIYPASVFFEGFWRHQYGPDARWMWVYWTDPVKKEEALADGRAENL